MANYLKMAKVSAILTLKERGWSRRRIAIELGIHLDTVRRYIRLSEQDSKQVKAPIGSDSSKPAKAPTGSEAVKADHTESGRSQCVSFRKVIEDKLKQGLTLMYSMLYVDGKSLSLGSPNHLGIVSLSKFRVRG